jgi:cytochrome P450
LQEGNPSHSPPASKYNLTHVSETTATTLASALFYLAKYQDKQKKLQTLLDQAMPGGYNQWSYEKVKSVSYVDDFISETLRLKPALLTGGARETPAKGIQVGETYIPGNTNVVVPISLIQRDARYWPQPNEFVPERFGEKRAEMETDKAPYLPFSLGKFHTFLVFRTIMLMRSQARMDAQERTLRN